MPHLFEEVAVDDLLWIPRNLLGLWEFWFGDPLYPMALAPLVWQLFGIGIILLAVRPLHRSGR